MSESNQAHDRGPRDGALAGASPAPIQPDDGLAPAHDAAIAEGRGHSLWVALQILQVRLRFILLILALGLAIGYWDTIKNYWDKWTRPPQSTSATGAKVEYYCPMHLQVVREAPGNCPICGMPLSRREVSESGAGGAQAASLPADVLTRTQYSPYRVALAGVSTTPVRYQPLTKRVETVGYVAYDETRRSKIVLRAGGYVEKLYVDQDWVPVERGTPLAEIYSPELVSAARELLVAAERSNLAALRDAAREKLRLLGISSEEIDAIERTGKVQDRILLRSPQQGQVIRKGIIEGQAVTAGQTLYDIADLTRVWIEADVYEKDLALLHAGQDVQVATEAFPGEVFSGRISVIYKELNPSTRTQRIRLEIDNSALKLRPGMYATAAITAPLAEIEPYRSAAARNGEVLAVPAASVIDTGKQKVVYVERDAGLFDGVAVDIGPRAGDFYPVLRGLSEGDRVATAGAFLLDAETRLNPAASAGYFGARGGPQGDAQAAPGASQAHNAAAKSDQSAEQPEPAEPEGLAELSPEDRRLAVAQRLCPITEQLLGVMGKPHKITLEGRTVFLCCSGCESEAREHPTEVFAKLEKFARGEWPKSE